MNTCQHENIEWTSGQEGIVIPLNGPIVARCLDCGAVATEEGE